MSTNPTGMRQRGYKEWGGTSQPSSVRAQAAFGDESHKKVSLAEETSQEGTAGTSELSSVTEAGDWAGHVRKAIEPRPSCASVSGSHYSDDHFCGENEKEMSDVLLLLGLAWRRESVAPRRWRRE